MRVVGGLALGLANRGPEIAYSCTMFELSGKLSRAASQCQGRSGVEGGTWRANFNGSA